MKNNRDDWFAIVCCVVIILAIWYGMIMIAAEFMVSL